MSRLQGRVLPGPGEQGLDLLDGLRVGEVGKDLGEVGVGFEAVDLGGLDEAVEVGGSVGAFLRGRE